MYLRLNKMCEQSQQHFLKFVFLVTASCTSIFAMGNEQFITLYSESNQKGSSVIIGEDYVKNFCNGWNSLPYQIKSACVNGTWILYEAGNFNSGFERAKIETLSGRNVCRETLKDFGLCTLRFAGHFEDFNANTFTLYEQIRFGGDQHVMTNSTPYFESEVSGKSFIITGPSSWTIYAGDSYSGRSYCLKPSPYMEVIVAFIPDITAKPLKFPSHGIRSIRKGCFGK